MRAAAPGMREHGWGRVVNVSSSSGKRPSAATPEYSVAKAAELSLSRLYADRYAARRRATGNSPTAPTYQRGPRTARSASGWQTR